MVCKFCDNDEVSHITFGKWMFFICEEHQNILLKAAKENIQLTLDFRC